MKSKNKLVPRLLGITKESVLRVEEKTKDVVQEWPLTTVKRWAASPKSFTLVRPLSGCHLGLKPTHTHAFTLMSSGIKMNDTTSVTRVASAPNKTHACTHERTCHIRYSAHGLHKY